MPKSYVESLGEQERILLVARQHWLVLTGAMLTEVIVVGAVIVLSFIAAVTLPASSLIILPVAIVLLLIPLIGIIRDALMWQNRQFIVTNRRVMQVAGIFNKDVTDSSLEKVNDVKMVQTALGRMFNYGDVEILTASELGANLFRRIGDPVRFKTTMLNAKQRLETEMMHPSIERDEASSSNIPAMIAQLDQLRRKGILTEEEFQRKKSELLSKL